MRDYQGSELAELVSRPIPRRSSTTPKPPVKAKITVSIPVKVGGYTGQRDQWEETAREFNVRLEDDGHVSLSDPSGNLKRKIILDPEALQEALRILRPAVPVMR